ncbi:LytR C-terminal domain-containing protein [Streptomyces sp. NPDC059582]|uniref:LytR C-terminal domain-containing protein n=1 Tax=Streptomyces sp. NPDC059582 TaxID=3346875 RepID=UPI0036A736B1
MNDRYDAEYGGDQYEIVGYDEYGRPIYQQVQAQQAPRPARQAYDPYPQQQGYGYDPYATGGRQPAPPYDPYDTGQQQPVPPYDTGQQPPVPPYDTGQQQPVSPYDTGQQPPVPPYDAYDPYGTATRPGAGAPGGTRAPYDPYGQTAAGAQQSRVAEQTAYIPQQAGPAQDTGAPRQEPSDAADPSQRDYRTEQFAFVEEPDGDSEDVIDWMAFTENRTERREEARRRARSRVVALVVVLALVAAGGVGYLWHAGKLPGLSKSDSKTGGTTASGAQNRDVIVVHLHNTKKGGTSTALLVDNTTTKQGSTVLLPNSLAVTDDDGSSTTLAKSVDDDGSSGTRDALDTVLGTDIEGTWRLDTPYLQNLVDLVGNIEVDTDADVPDPDAGKKSAAPLVHKGKDQTLSGKMAVAYATYSASGEAQNAQLERFGQVMQGVLRKVSSDAQGATVTVQTLAQILDPSLTDKDLGTFLAKLADLAKGGDYKTALLPVQSDGTLSAETSDSVVKDVLGGTAKSPDQGSAVRVSVRNASGTKGNTEKARVVLLNGGFTFLDGGAAATSEATSEVTYADAADKENATEVAKTLGLPADAVTKGKVSANATVVVVLGQDYKPSSS